MGGPRITNEQTERIRELRRNGMKVSEISKALGVSQYAVKTKTGDIEVDAELVLVEAGEELAAIDGYDGVYVVSSHGRVFSTRHPDGLRQLKLHASKKGGLKAVLNGKMLRVDHLVAKCFCVEDYGSDMMLEHINGDINDNRAINLRWIKRVEPLNASNHARPHVLSSEQVDAIQKRWLAGEGIGCIAKDFGVSYSTAYKCIDGLVRDNGRVYSTGRGRRNPKIIAPTINRSGYKRVHLADGDGHGRTFAVHRLVAAAFCDGYDELHCIVNHKDGDPSNNHADNLEWCTAKENTQHAINELGREIGGSLPFETRSVREVVRGPSKKSPTRRFTDEEATAIRNDPRSARQLAKIYGVNKCTIINIRRGFTYRELP